MIKYFEIFLVLFNLMKLIRSDLTNMINEDIVETKHFMYWPNATVPFYINPQHFDHEQSLAIMKVLSFFAFKTCLKFNPVLVEPTGEVHAMLIQNPSGVRRCVFDNRGHSMDGPHIINLGYDCLRAPNMEMMLMRALGFPFEHNRAIRDLYIDVQFENVEPGDIELFTKDNKLPLELRTLPYDPQSVMHFGEREYSKNGHRTIIFKDYKFKQNRVSLTPTDIRKINIVYGPECKTRDRREKIELCQSYPGVARRKRDAETDATKSLRVNPNITPPSDNTTNPGQSQKAAEYMSNITEQVSDNLKELGIEDEVQNVVEQVYKITSIALQNARAKYCNDTKPILRTVPKKEIKNTTDILGIIQIVSDYTRSIVENAVANLTAFCESSNSLDAYQRMSCPYYDNNSWRCRGYYKSTKSGPVMHSTQHRPIILQSTKHRGVPMKRERYPMRVGNLNEETVTEASKVKREVTAPTMIHRSKRQAESNDTKDEKLGKMTLEEKENGTVNGNVTGTTLMSTAADILRMGTMIYNEKKTEFEPIRRYENEPKRSRKRKKKSKKEMTDESDIAMDRKERGKRLKEEDSGDSVEMEERQRDNRKDKIEPHGNEEMENKEQSAAEKDKKTNKAKKNSHYMDNNEGNVRTKKRHEKKISKVDDTDLYGKDEEEAIRNENKERENERKRKKEAEDNSLERKNSLKSRQHSLPKTIKLSKPNEEFYSQRRWTDGVVRYIITDFGEDSKYDIDDLSRRLKEINDILSRKTCVRLQEITEKESSKYRDYLVLDTSPDYVTGMVGGRQNFGAVDLFEGGQHKQHTAMMVMAMLGFYFEVARHDRDKYIRVHMRHVRPDKLHHFEKIRSEATLSLPYDYKSATHPAWQFWRKIGKTGISTVATYKDQDPDGTVMKTLGQNAQLLSDIDIVKINSVYGVKCFNRISKKPRTDS